MTSRDLAQLQKRLQQSIIGETAFSDAAAGTRVNAATRTDVYVNAYRLRLIDALAANFPRLQRFMGTAAFAALAENYLAQFPSTSVSVRWFGDRLAQFLRDDHTSAVAPWLADLADWEWEIAAAFDSPDAPPIALVALNVAPEEWPRLRFTLHPSVRLLRLQTNAVELFSAISDDAAMPEACMLDRPQAYAIWRQEFEVRFRIQDDDEAHTLTLLGQDATFDAMCGDLCDWHEASEVPARAASLLRTWITDGMIAGVTSD
ncbi:MAG: DNA-binding domain-containing protein [Steroidobacteraceae bacterium]